MIGLTIESIVTAILTAAGSVMIWQLVFTTPRLSLLTRLLLVMCLGCLLVSQFSAWIASYVSWRYDSKIRNTEQGELRLGSYHAARRWRRLRMIMFLAFIALGLLAVAASGDTTMWVSSATAR
jgi:hypothetical protein